MSSEIIFEVTEAEEGGYCASALGYGITTQAETLSELRDMVRDATACYLTIQNRDEILACNREWTRTYANKYLINRLPQVHPEDEHSSRRNSL